MSLRPVGTSENTAVTWHCLEPQEARDKLDVPKDGLSPDEAAARLVTYGENRLPTAHKIGPIRRFAQQFNNVLIYVLLAAAITSLILQQPIDAAVIFGVVIINALIGFIQEGRAEQALAAIRVLIDPNASVLRAGRRITIPAADIVPGDIVILEAGDRVGADLRLIEARSLKIDEAVLTGESLAEDKTTAPVDADTVLGDRQSMAFSGTFVAAGRGSGIAVATGAQTELGNISNMIARVETLKTPLIRQTDRFARRFTIIILAVSVIAFLFAHFVQSYPAADAFMAVVGLAVAAIPEGLPAIMSITLAIGVQRMAKRNAIIRRLPAVETLGSVSVICTDKTGTLTRNEMLAATLITMGSRVDVDGVGYTPTGDFKRDDRTIDPLADTAIADLIRTGLLCNDAELRQAGDNWRVDGDPMEGALVCLAMKAGFDIAHERAGRPRLDDVPFDADQRYMATLHDGAAGRTVALIKGAPEEVIAMCDMERQTDGDRPIDATRWTEKAAQLAEQGQRVLAFAMENCADSRCNLDGDLTFPDATLIGLIGFVDPPRKQALNAIAACHTSGVRVVMITGDHAVTAREIGRQLGLAEDPVTLTGRDLDALDDDALTAIALKTDVFARTTPAHKLSLVRALQRSGRIVAMTGDGVNDAPALKRADVGVAMGQKGTEAAKEAAEMVLADDNFASIVHAVREGRTVYDNLMKVIAWTLPTSCGEALTILAALAFGLTLPITPVQILWVNMVTTVTLGLVLGFDPTEPGTMRRPPRTSDGGIMRPGLVTQTIFVSVLFVISAFGVYFAMLADGQSLDSARTAVVNTFVVMEIFYLIAVRHPGGIPASPQAMIGTRIAAAGIISVTVLQVMFTYVPFMNTVFATAPLSIQSVAWVFAAAFAMIAIVEICKRMGIFNRS